MPSPVRKLREALGLNQADFAKLIGRSIQTVQIYEAGIPNEMLDQLARIAGENDMPYIHDELQAMKTSTDTKPQVVPTPADVSRRLSEMQKEMRAGFARLEAALARTPAKARMTVRNPERLARRRNRETK